MNYHVTTLHVLTLDESRAIIEAAQHIEDICPRPGPYYPAFVALIRLAELLKSENS